MADTCGCCGPNTTPTPAAVENRPALSAISFRAGTYSSFLRAMIDRIARDTPPTDPDYPWVIRDLQTRASDDYAITLLEMWATLADILCFYEERFANEGFLRTAIQRDSVLRLARLVGYQFRPGLSATTLLAFTLDPAARVTLPVGLRVQSVTADGQTPQKFETTRSITADGRFNRLALGSRPVPVEPFAAGTSTAFLAPGDRGLTAGAALKRGDRVVLFENSSPSLELLTVQDVTPVGDRFEISWSRPIGASGWSLGITRARRYDRTFRLFGHSAPASTMTPVVDNTVNPPKITGWTTSPTTWTYPGTGPFESSTSILLDGRYEGLKVGGNLLVVESGSVPGLLEITGVDQVAGDFATLTDTVTRVVVNPVPGSPAPPAAMDRRNVLIYELTSAAIPFWGWDFPQRLLDGSFWVPGRRTGWTSIEIGRTIESGQFKPGTDVDLRDIELGRPVIVTDSQATVIQASIADAYFGGTDIRVGPTPGDSITAVALGLASANTLRVTALSSGILGFFMTLSSATPELYVTIGTVGPRRIPILSTGSVFAIANSIENGITNADPAPEFSKARVYWAGNRIVVVPGLLGTEVRVAPTAADPTSALELALDASIADYVDGVLSASLDAFTGVPSVSPQLLVTRGARDPQVVALAGPIGSVIQARNALSQALNPPAHPTAIVDVVDNRLLILPTLGDQPSQAFLVLRVETDDNVDLDAASAALLGNVAAASHGETVKNEIVGSAEASLSFQQFTLSKTPLTYVPGAGPRGALSTLQLLVNGVEWSEVTTLYGHGPTESVFVTRLADDATTTIEFGDGLTGARPPSGSDNLVARYRKGSGLAGRLRAGALTNLLDRPVGVKSVLNPAPTDGGADAETAADMRRNAPTTVRTFDRAVSLRDFTDLVTASGEVAKASASWVWRGDRRCVFLTIGAQQGGLFSRDALARLYGTLTAERDPNHALIVENYLRVPIVLAATLAVLPTYVTSAVLGAARDALSAALSFDALAFGAPLHLSRLYEVLQSVDGVDYVDVTTLQFKNRSAAYLASRGADAAPVQGHLRLYPARVNAGQVTAAELAWVEAPTQDITLLASGGLPD